jgi:hypothetical protein
MTNDDKYKLTCLIEGDRNAFPISISRDADIDELTQVVYEKGQLGISGRRLLDLKFWKVCKFLPH